MRGMLTSRPARARGLKQFLPQSDGSTAYVAPRAGAWIETRETSILSTPRSMSRPARARGLKQEHPLH